MTTYMNIADMNAFEQEWDRERESIRANDAARFKLANYLEDTMLMGDDDACLQALESGFDIVLSINTGTFIASFARQGEALRYASTLPYACTVIRADNCGEMIHHVPAFTNIAGV